MNFPVLAALLKIIAITIPLLLAVAFLTLAERKVLASMQRRKGPNVVGIVGIFQPIADGLKLLVKEPVLPSSANIVIFLFAPVLTFFASQVAWAVIPFDQGAVLADLNCGLLYVFAISSLGVYGMGDEDGSNKDSCEKQEMLRGVDFRTWDESGVKG